MGRLGLGPGIPVLVMQFLPSRYPGPNAPAECPLRGQAGRGGKRGAGAAHNPSSSPPLEVKIDTATWGKHPALGRGCQRRTEDTPAPRAARAHKTVWGS